MCMPLYFLFVNFKRKSMHSLVFILLAFYSTPLFSLNSTVFNKSILDTLNINNAAIISAQNALDIYVKRKDTSCIIDTYDTLALLYKGKNDSVAAKMLYQKIRLTEIISNNNEKNKFYFSKIEAEVKKIELQINKESSDKNIFRMKFLFVGFIISMVVILYLLYKQNNKIDAVLTKVSYSNKVKSNFLGNISKEILQPLDIIEANATAFGKESLNDEQNTYVSNIYNASKNLRAMTSDIFDFNIHKTQKYKLNLSSNCLNDFIDEISESVKLQVLKKTDLQIEIIKPKGPKKTLVFDKTKLQQVLLNLLNNAIKFTESGTISFHVKIINQDDEFCYILFEVFDTGKGIKPENISLIFDEFYQEDSVYTRYYSGTGLGLSISQKIIQLMNSKIKVSSVLGEGTCFSFVLKLKKEANVK